MARGNDSGKDDGKAKTDVVLQWGTFRLGDERIVRLGALITAVGLALALLWRDPVPATLGFALSGLGLSNVVPVMYGTAGHALAGRGIALVAAIGYGGFLLGPPVIGFVARHLGLPAALGIALAGAALIAVVGGRAFALVRGVDDQGGSADERRPAGAKS